MGTQAPQDFVQRVEVGNGVLRAKVLLVVGAQVALRLRMKVEVLGIMLLRKPLVSEVIRIAPTDARPRPFVGLGLGVI